MKKYLLPSVFVLIACGYLFLSHGYIYRHIGSAQLRFPEIASAYALPESESSSDARVVYAALGDSLTSGVGATSYTESYPYLLATWLGKKQPVTLHTYSYPGIRTIGLIETYLPQAIASRPDIVTVLIGTNDIHGKISSRAFERNYRVILEKLTSETKAKIYAISIPYIGSNTLLLPPNNYYFDYRTSAFNAIIERLAKEYNVTYIDIATPTQELMRRDSALYAADSFHPSALGYRLWADIIYDTFNQ